MGYFLSVIIPVYNVEKYIAYCLDSIVGQSLGIENIEVIVVNDCTPDQSMSIVESYAKKYPTIKIIERDSNGGAGAARNTGLLHVTSPYVTFIDPDDFITENAFQYLLNITEEYNCEVVIYEYEYYSPSGRHYPRNPSAALFGKDQLITDISQTPEIIFATSVCNKLFNMKLFKNIEFMTTKFEDVRVSAQTTFRAKRIYVTNGCTYFYRKREEEELQSTMDDYLNKRSSYFDHLEVNLEMYRLCTEYPQYKEMIDWFNTRSFTPFLITMLKKPILNLKEKKFIYDNARIFLSDVSRKIINKLENPLYIYAMRILSRSNFYSFYGKVLTKGISNKLKHYSKRLVKAADITVCFLIFTMVRLMPKFNNAWLVCERGHDAQDNGFHFYKYIRQNHPDLNAYYLIDRKNESDFRKVKALGNFVQYKSLKHKLLFLGATHLVSAHRGTIEPWNYNEYRKLFGNWTPTKKYVFLQHGITKDDVSDVLGRAYTPFDLFITGAKLEYNYISNNFGYMKHEVKHTGFARFDSLYEYSTKNQILLMPTWRNGIVRKSWDPHSAVTDDVFLGSDYYKQYQSFLNNERLHSMLQSHGFKLVFYPHAEVQQYLRHFSTASDNIILANERSYDVQTLLKESKLLITDFSSVFFDFAYMGKPVLYYQFDRHFFFQNHYKKGYFDYDRDGFGEVIFEENDLLEKTAYYFASDFVMKQKYLAKVDDFFGYRDRKNCERIYQAITNLK